MDQIFIDHVIGNLKCYNAHSKFRNVAKEWRECVRNTNVRIYTFTPVWLWNALGVTSLLPNDSMWPLIKQIKIFFWYTDYISKVNSFLSYTRKLLGCLLGISPSGRNPCKGKLKKKKDSGGQQYCRDNSILNNNKIIHMCSTQNCK